MTSVSPYLSIHSVLVAQKINKMLHIPVELLGEQQSGEENVERTLALADTGAGGKFIDQQYARKKKYPLKKLPRTLTVFNVDGTLNKTGTIKHFVTLWMTINGRRRKENLLVTGLGKQKIILGFPWFEEANPLIDWAKGELTWRRNTTEKTTIEEIKETPSINAFIPEWYPQNPLLLHQDIVSGTKEVVIQLLKQQGTMEQKKIHVNATYTPAQIFELKYGNKTQLGSIRDHVPPEYHRWLSVFDEKAASRLPEHKPYDHGIDLKEGFIPKVSKIYPMTPEEEELLKKFLEENLAKGYIEKSNSPQASGIFYVPKKDGTK